MPEQNLLPEADSAGCQDVRLFKLCVEFAYPEMTSAGSSWTNRWDMPVTMPVSILLYLYGWPPARCRIRS